MLGPLREGESLELNTFAVYVQTKTKCIVTEIVPIYRIFRDLEAKHIKCDIEVEIIANETLIFVVSRIENKKSRFHLPLSFDSTVDLARLRKISIHLFETKSELCVCFCSPETIIYQLIGHNLP